MKKGILLIAVALLVFGYLGSRRLNVLSSDDSHTKLSDMRPVTQDLKNLRDAYTSTWKGSKIQLAQETLKSPGQITTSNPKMTIAKKEDAKKKKKRVAKKAKLKRFEVQIVNNENPGSRSQPFAAATEYPNSVGVFVPPQDPARDTPQTVDEWMARLVNPINKEALDNMILSFQSGLISGELFYGVVDKLMENDETEIQQLGLIALSSTPSPQSFDKTVKFIERGSNNPNSNNARDVILAYKKIELVGILNQQVYSIDSGIQFQAAMLIRDSALDFLKLRPQVDPNAPQPSPSPAVTPTRSISSRDLQVYAQAFSAMQSVLANGQTQHQAVFQETIQILQKLLNG